MNAILCIVAAVAVFGGVVGGFDKPKDDPPPAPVASPVPAPPPGECPKDKFDPTPCVPGVWTYQEAQP